MGTVGVDARLEPNPAIADFAVGMGARDFQLHRITTSHGDVYLAGANADGVVNGGPAHVRNAGPLADQRDFLG